MSKTGSHPVIRFEQVPVVEGKLTTLTQGRPALLRDVVERTQQELASAPLETLLGEALYSERLRLKRFRPNVFTKKRYRSDRALWSQVQEGMVRPAGESDRKQLLKVVLQHYADEIGGRFDPRVYRFATHAAPWAFSWLLNAASVRRFLPWGMTESLQSRLHILGEVPHLQRLARQGTILLVPTHQSNIDSVLVGYVIYLMQLPPFAYGAGLNLFSNPILNFFMGNLGAYTVDRSKSNAVYKNLLKNYSTKMLKEGMHSIFFPGGTRSRSGAIESRVKLGLLGTALDAQIENLRAGIAKPNIYIVPMTTSYHFVLEASSLIEDYLAESGKSRFIFSDDESWHPTEVLKFFWKIFSSKAGTSVRIGKPLDVFGNFVDDEGQSIGPNGTLIDPRRWLTTRGQLGAEPQRDQEYTRELGVRLTERFHRENTVLSSHTVAFALMESLRVKYPDLDLYRFLRLSTPQRTIPYSEFLANAEKIHRKLREMADRGQLFLSSELATWDLEKWVGDGIQQLGLMHEAAVAQRGDTTIWTEDMNLLYFYRNRLSGFGLSLFEQSGVAQRTPGQHDAKGFLA
ncbi:1-acyl-sn-glycerol-3-phosphate acyltransferase [Bdellovibrionota bacterium FG-1]